MHGDENTDGEAFDNSHLDIDFECPQPVDEMLFPDIYVGLDIDLLTPGDSIVTDRRHASADRYEADDPQNQIAGQISPFTLSEWLRHGCERVSQTAGATACHPGTAGAEYIHENVYDRNLQSETTLRPSATLTDPTRLHIAGPATQLLTAYSGPVYSPRSPLPHRTLSVTTLPTQQPPVDSIAGESR